MTFYDFIKFLKKTNQPLRHAQRETFEKCSILFKATEGDNFNHRNTLSISRINQPKSGGGLKFEPDTGIGQKGTFFKSLGEVTRHLDDTPL